MIRKFIVTGFLALLLLAAVFVNLKVDRLAAQYNTACYTAQGGEMQVAGSGCEYEFLSGSTLDVQTSNATFATAKFGDVAGGNYAEIEADGSLAFYGDATVFDDIRVPVSSTKNGGTKDPDFAVWKTDGSGSQGVFVEWFDKSTEEEVYFSMQLPHSWKTGTDIEPHVHWIPKADGSAGAVVNWGLECNWTAIGDTGITTTIIYSSSNHAGDTTLVADKHYLSDLGVMDGSTIAGVSSMAVCRVFRDATGALATDDYDNDAGLLEIDFHYEVDALGSRTEYVK